MEAIRTVARLLPVGSGSVTAEPKQLCRVLQIDERSLREEIDREVQQGIPICASLSGGYYVAATFEDAKPYLAMMRKRGLATVRKIKAIEGAFQNEKDS